MGKLPLNDYPIASMAISKDSPQQFRVDLLGDEDAGAWNRFVCRHGTGHLLQSWEWGSFKGEFGWRPVRLAVRDAGGEIQAAASVLFRRAARGFPISVAYVPRGPVLTCEAQEAAATLLAGLHRLCRQERSMVLKFEPNWDENTDTKRLLEAWGFRPAQIVQSSRSIVLDLQGAEPEDALLGAMKPKARYNIRLAARRGIRVREAQGADDLNAFHALMTMTGQRDEFPVESVAFYEKLLSGFSDALSQPRTSDARHEKPLVVLLLAFHADYAEPLAGLIVSAFGPEAIYLYGASADRGREHMAAYLLQWEAIRWARRMGCERYDFWGIPSEPNPQAPAGAENPNVRNGLWGVYRFKQGFGGREVTSVGAWDYVYRPMLYPIFQRFMAWKVGSSSVFPAHLPAARSSKASGSNL